MIIGSVDKTAETQASHRLDTSPFIGSVFKDFLRQIYALASNMDINLMGVK